MWKVTVLTLFKEMFPGPLKASLSGNALKNGKWSLETIDIRDFSNHKHKSVDDTCYGGGKGMLLRPEVVHDALMYAINTYDSNPLIVYLSPRGVPFTQEIAKDFSKRDGCIILCGRYEGIDDRVIEYFKSNYGLLEISIGDYVLSCGEIGAFTIIDACVRLFNLSKEAVEKDSFQLDLLEFPQYTKPRVWNGMSVPDVLLSGHHEKIRLWREEQSLRITEQRRPDLLNKSK